MPTLLEKFLEKEKYVKGTEVVIKIYGYRILNLLSVSSSNSTIINVQEELFRISFTCTA
jgi:hypothetical protein